MAGQTDTIIGAILDDIERGVLRPGDFIEDGAIMARHDVSRTPVREALIQLETAGLVERVARKGAVVFKPTLEQFLAILEVHAKLEGQAAGLAARRLSAPLSDKLETAVSACEAHAREHGDGAPDAYYQLNMDFHRIVAEAAGNPYLLELIKTNARKLMAYYRARYHYRGVIATSAKEHRAIAERIMARDAEAAEAMMERHVSFDHVTALDLLAALG
ncbi:GntR family transcriptional regulator [uncultured Lentibacter sp.]|uniref:GntR family transcriptional regulator n=1 Tax=uncultured Lentibacter sp. TaxID=1659309 RepID=UPI0026148062|nr:GntR family transcriptional regulator [uncultured Lentibacter sp.]